MLQYIINKKGYKMKAIKELSVNESLGVIATNKEVIKVASEDNRKLFKELFITINDEIKNIKTNDMFKNTKKSALVTIAKTNLKVSNKDYGLFSLVCNYISLGLSLDLNVITVNQVKRAIYFINKEMTTKTKVNKANDLKELLSVLNKDLKETK